MMDNLPEIEAAIKQLPDADIRRLSGFAGMDKKT